MTTTRIDNAELVVAYDAAADTHVYRRDSDVVFDEARILHVGPGYTGRGRPHDRRRAASW